MRVAPSRVRVFSQATGPRPDGLIVSGMSPSIAVWHPLIIGWVQWLTAAGRSHETIRLRRHQLYRLAEAHPDGPDLTADELVVWLASQAWAPETRRAMRSAIRGFYRWAVRAGHLDRDPSVDLPAIRATDPPPRPAPEAVVAAGLGSPESRVRLMVALAARQGLRRAEIAAIHSDDVVQDLLGWSLRVRGKGGRVRVVPLHDDVAGMLRDRPPGWAFPSRSGHLSAGHVGKLIAGALPGAWTAHPLRHRFGTVAYAGSRDLLAVQQLMGHARPETTRRYIRLSDAALRSAVRAAA